MKEIVINACYGGFCLSEEACKLLGLDGPYSDVARDDPKLVEVVKRLGVKANGSCARLKIVEIPDDVDWEIDEYDGNECVAECHQTWA